MKSAKTEFLEFIKDKPKIKCCEISTDYKTFNLPCNYSKGDFNCFLNLLNFKYDSGYGGQELFGTIWFIDDTWADRGEYDGAEWWQYQKCPDIPEVLL